MIETWRSFANGPLTYPPRVKKQFPLSLRSQYERDLLLGSDPNGGRRDIVVTAGRNGASSHAVAGARDYAV